MSFALSIHISSDSTKVFIHCITGPVITLGIAINGLRRYKYRFFYFYYSQFNFMLI